MLVFVHLDNCVQAFLQRMSVCCETDDGKDERGIILGLGRAANLEDFGGIAGIDVVAGCEVCARDCES
jgi:hypothetical protein